MRGESLKANALDGDGTVTSQHSSMGLEEAVRRCKAQLADEQVRRRHTTCIQSLAQS